jgi:hypothetical protein
VASSEAGSSCISWKGTGRCLDREDEEDEEDEEGGGDGLSVRFGIVDYNQSAQ